MPLLIFPESSQLNVKFNGGGTILNLPYYFYWSSQVKQGVGETGCLRVIIFVDVTNFATCRSKKSACPACPFNFSPGSTKLCAGKWRLPSRDASSPYDCCTALVGGVSGLQHHSAWSLVHEIHLFIFPYMSCLFLSCSHTNRLILVLNTPLIHTFNLHIYLQLFTHIFLYMFIFTHIIMCLCIYVCVCTYDIYIYVYMCIYIYMYLYMHTDRFTYYIYIYTHTFAYVYSNYCTIQRPYAYFNLAHYIYHLSVYLPCFFWGHRQESFCQICRWSLVSRVVFAVALWLSVSQQCSTSGWPARGANVTWHWQTLTDQIGGLTFKT